MTDRIFIKWNALLVLFALLFWLATLLIDPGEQSKDPARPKALVYHAQRHEALRSEPGSAVPDHQPNNPDSPLDQAARFGSAD